MPRVVSPQTLLRRAENLARKQFEFASLSDGQRAALRIGQHVAHNTWGDDEVMRLDGDALTVAFGSVGYQTLALSMVVRNALLQRAA